MLGSEGAVPTGQGKSQAQSLLVEFGASHRDGVGSAFPCALVLSASSAAKERAAGGMRGALLIPLLFLFQRARQMDEELNRRGSPVPKKVGGFSAQGILCFGKPAPRSWPFPQCERVQAHRQLCGVPRRCSLSCQPAFLLVTKGAASLGGGG